jgi:hypothetical protein
VIGLVILSGFLVSNEHDMLFSHRDEEGKLVKNPMNADCKIDWKTNMG